MQSNAYYLNKYGITLIQYEEILALQGGGCGICGKHAKTRALAVDHDHKTGKVRGLLCYWCNAKLIARSDNAEIHRKAANYLEAPPAGYIYKEG